VIEKGRTLAMTGVFSITNWMALRVCDEVTSADGDAARAGEVETLAPSLRRRVTTIGQRAMQVASVSR
jgi:hypothetical protein